MPARQAAPLVSLRGDGAYARYLDRVIRALKNDRGTTVANYHQLAEHALVALGLQFGLKAPPRTRPAHRPRKARADG
jgi:hypothetical protein